MITLKRCSNVGYYVFLLDVQFSFGLCLPLLLTEIEASFVKMNAKVLMTLPDLKKLSAQRDAASRQIHQDGLRQYDETSARTSTKYH